VKYLVVLLALSSIGCVQLEPPRVAVLERPATKTLRRVAVLPTSCETQECKGIEATIKQSLEFVGYSIVDIDSLNMTTWNRLEVRTSYTGDQSSSVHVERVGVKLSDLDVWALRDELAKLGVEGVVTSRVMTGPAFGTQMGPHTVEVMVRLMTLEDLQLKWSRACRVEVSLLTQPVAANERALRCALAEVGKP